MSDESRCCGGRCGEPQMVGLSRRGFLGLAAGTAAMTLAKQMAWADDDQATRPTTPKVLDLRAYPRISPRVYRGKNLEAVAMPLGGIGTGSLWLDGHGRLSVWQIFNNLERAANSRQFFRRSCSEPCRPAVARVLQTTQERSLKPVESLKYEGGYPIARLTFHDAALPVDVRMEAMNPMIPLDAANSSIPCVLFRLTAKNPGTPAVDVTSPPRCKTRSAAAGAMAFTACASADTAGIAIAW